MNTCVEKNPFDDEKNFKALDVQYSIFEFKVFQAEPKPTLKCCYVRRREKKIRRAEVAV